MRIAVMQGNLRDFDLAQVLAVVSIGRQYTGIELALPGDRLGTIFVKSGQVVSASENSQSGRDAFHSLFPANNGRFTVFRTDTPAELPEPLGPLHVLMNEAQELTALVDSRRTARPPDDPPGASASTPMAQASVESPSLEIQPPAESPSLEIQAPVASPSTAAPVRRAMSNGHARSLGIVSPKGGSGKSTIALNLALSLARRGHSVVLVDGDVNGDILSAINARARVKRGALDVIAGAATVDEALLETVNPRLKLMPAVGEQLPDPELLALDPRRGWPSLMEELGRRADLVIVDTPSGVFGPTRPILGAVSHVLGVLQAEVIAARSFKRFDEGLASLPQGQRPDVIGVVLNMLQTRHHASLAVFQEALQGLPGAWLFDTTIPRHPAFLEATHQGLPLRHLDEDAPPAVAFLFDNLAGEVAERLGLPVPKVKAQPFLV
jgi:chromosome partitioning protein